MRERVAHVLQSLPPEGVAIHGTNLALAKRIANGGMSRNQRDNSLEYSDAHYYFIQPRLTGDNPQECLKQLNYALSDAIFIYAHKAIRKNAYLDLKNIEESRVPALVILKPGDCQVQPLYPNFCAPVRQHDNIPPRDIYGYVTLPIITDNTKERDVKRFALQQTIKLLEEKGVINSGGLQLPQVK